MTTSTGRLNAAHANVEPYRGATAHSAHAETDWVKSSIPKSALLIDNGRYDIKQYVSRGTEPLHRRKKV